MQSNAFGEGLRIKISLFTVALCFEIRPVSCYWSAFHFFFGKRSIMPSISRNTQSH